MTITAIGFANKFYTLWNITDEYKDLGNGRTYVVTHYNYIKNISFDKETALAKYPGATLDENLRGKTASWDSKPKEIWDNVNVFRFGKYIYKNIEESTDIDYIAWYWDQITDESHKEFVSNVLKNHGYEIRKSDYDGHEYLMSSEAIKQEQEHLVKVNDKLNQCRNGFELSIFMTSNPDYFGEYRDGDIIYKFNKVEEKYYQGYDYYLPVLNGKAKRVKNKNLVITDYTYKFENNILTIIIDNFIIKK